MRHAIQSVVVRSAASASLSAVLAPFSGNSATVCIDQYAVRPAPVIDADIRPAINGSSVPAVCPLLIYI